jgi:DNA-directed RNA polymerase specialized sigma24 family protein
LVSDSGAAEEITQEVFLQIWNKAGTYQEEQGKVISWLASIARHRAIDTLRGIPNDLFYLSQADG